jgi:hypothetical protein
MPLGTFLFYGETSVKHIQVVMWFPYVVVYLDYLEVNSYGVAFAKPCGNKLCKTLKKISKTWKAPYIHVYLF